MPYSASTLPPTSRSCNPCRRIFAHAVTIGGYARRLPTLTITSWDRSGKAACRGDVAQVSPCPARPLGQRSGLPWDLAACCNSTVNILSHAPIVSEWHVAAVSGERVVDIGLFRASVFRYLLMVSTSLSASFVAVRPPLEGMFLAFRRLACDMPRSVNSGATIELSVCCRRCARTGPVSVP